MNMTRAILERVQEVELQLTPEFQKPTGVDMWAGVPDKTRKLVDVMVEKGHLAPIGMVPSVATPVLVHPTKLKDPKNEESLIDDLEKWEGGAIYNANTQMGSYDPIMVLWPLEGSSWAGFWGDVVDVVLNVNDLTAQYGEVGEDEGSFEEPKTSSDDTGTMWWDFGGASVLVGRIYPSKKQMDILGHASSVDVRMDELMKMFSWLRDKYVDYNIVVYGGQPKRENMADLVNAGMINKFVPEAKEER